MALPELIEITPLQQPVRAAITVPGSKSITNRALILAALADGETILRGGLWSEDTQVMVECLQELGFLVTVGTDPEEPCNRTITIYGKHGVVPAGGSETRPVELFAANAGTAARFLTAFVCLGKGAYRIHGTDRMHERPQAALFKALRQLGYRIESSNDRLPAMVYGGGTQRGKCLVSVLESSQFASALLLCAGVGGWQVEVEGESEENLPYVRMTSELARAFPKSGGEFPIEPDASSGSYFWAAGKLSGILSHPSGDIRVVRWPGSGWQVDQRFPEFLAPPPTEGGGMPRPVFTKETISRRHDLADSIMTAIVLAPFSPTPVRFTDLGRLRVQECERVRALKTELTRCGAEVVEAGDTLRVHPSALHGGEIETYEDHRMAMCFAVLGLKVPGIRIRDPRCVRKTFPDFFQKLASPPPGGLGVLIRNPQTGGILASEELLAE
ncbi:MAG TPA: 3-phosphoshikimate 1-carboxyvinyltransferase [Verrucomicrobiae bacterium]